MASTEEKTWKKNEEAKKLLKMYAEEEPLERGPDGKVLPVLIWGERVVDAVEDEDGKIIPLSQFGVEKVHCSETDQACVKCAEEGFDREKNGSITEQEPTATFLGKKYKPVALKVRPVYEELPERYRIKREILGDPLAGMPELPIHPTEYVPVERYEQDRKDFIDSAHPGDFLRPQERMLLHNMIVKQKEAFAWNDQERGTLRHDFFPPIEIPTVAHTVWVEKSIPIPRGQLEEFCKVIKQKIDAGVYESSNASYRSKFFGVIKKDGKSIRLVHALESLNAVTIAHSGIPPATEELADHFSGRACGGVLDLYSGYDARDLAESSRDYTTFQTPFGALRLVKLPQGWTNSVPIFHDDVNYALREEVPHVTRPYIDDVPLRGPASRYIKENGEEETIKENPGIRRFVWEHMQNANRVLQRLKYCGLTVSGKKAVICAEEFVVVGHTCSAEGRRPSTDRVGVIQRWPPLKNVSEVRQFLGVLTYIRHFIKDFSILAGPINGLLRAGKEFEWGPKQQASMDRLKQAVVDCPAIRPLSDDPAVETVLQVDSSYKGCGLTCYQVDPIDPKKRYYARFASLPFDERQARFSQAKRELYGIKRALEYMQYWLLGHRNLILETDALYIKGMLDNPGMGPNATINRWIEQILMFHFRIRHVKGKTFTPDGLSRRDVAPGDEEYPDNDEAPEMHLPGMDQGWDYTIPQPLKLEDFKDKIDTRGGYLNTVFTDQGRGSYEGTMASFYNDCVANYQDFREEVAIVQKAYSVENVEIPHYVTSQVKEGEKLLPDEAFKWDPKKREAYPEDRRSLTAKMLDDRIRVLQRWLKNPIKRPGGFTDNAYAALIKYSTQFYIGEDGRLFRKDRQGMHKLVVQPEHRMYAMKAAHDSLGHRGVFATKSLLEVRLWWPEMERDVSWYVKTCHMCQVRQSKLLRIPPVPTTTPTLFQKVHTDVMVMGATSNGYKLVIASRDSLSRWLEAKALKADNAAAVGNFLLENVICRWGCPAEIVTDNAPQFLAALAWLEQKYGIIGINISPYNSQANGPVESGHRDVRQSVVKACGGNPNKWFWFLPQVIWADRITVRRGLGCSPYYAVTGCHPLLPLDIVEATWLVEYPAKIISTAELIGLRARSLAKHRQHVEEMRRRVDRGKREAVRRYELKYKYTIMDFNFKPGDIVLIRNTRIEKSLDKKAKFRYLGPMVVVRKTKGGSYLVCELNGAMYPGKVGRFRVIPYEQRRKIELTEDVEKLIDMGKEELDKLAAELEDQDEMLGKDLQFGDMRLNSDDDEDTDSEGETE